MDSPEKMQQEQWSLENTNLKKEDVCQVNVN